MRILSEAQTAALIAGARGTRFEAFYAVASKLGPRYGEFAGLMWEDVDFGRRALTIRRSVSTYRAGERWSPTKTGEEREILMPRSIESVLTRHRALQNEERLAAKGEWKNPKLVFPNRTGGVSRHAAVFENFKAHRARADLPDVRFHDLRHTAITLMLRHGVDVRTVADIAGHKDPAMTLRVYAHVLPSMQERAADTIDSYGF